MQPQYMHKESFTVFFDQVKSNINEAFKHQEDNAFMYQQRGFPPDMLRMILEAKPFRVAIPESYGGRGGLVHETLAILSLAAYHSLPLSLAFGINMGLFLQPVAKYAQEEIKLPLFTRFLNDNLMGGLMITEPDFGSDALHMRTYYTEDQTHYHLVGKKHWAGLTGMAEYWLLTARRKTASGDLQRDIDFFICDNTENDQKIVVEEYFDNLGLYFIPYGRNHLDVHIPKLYRLIPPGSGVQMMLDLLHRSRLQFPGMALGFIERILDEALAHCQLRQVGGKSLLSYDMVQERMSRLQGSYAVCAAMCLRSSKMAGLDKDLSSLPLEANTMKSVITDLMQEAAQSLVQLVGAKGYKLSHVAGRGIIDSRPFQIFEGSNDILYNQVAEQVVKQMKREKQCNLYQFLHQHPLARQASEMLREVLDFRLQLPQPQRKMVELGRVLSRIFSMEMLNDLGHEGFNPGLIQSGLATLQKDILQLMGGIAFWDDNHIVERSHNDDSWLKYAF